MEEKILLDIDRFISENSQAVFKDIARLVTVSSVAGAAQPGAPFGTGPRAALDAGLKLASELGLEAVDCGGMIGYAGLGAGESYLATITHLDVVPVGDGWSHDPFTMTEREGYIIGRGVMDDKGPSVLCLYALKYLKERGTALRYPVRALLGVAEETGMEDLDYYLNNYSAPLFCFSPDANFPLCNGEKGMLAARIVSKHPLENIADIRGGFAPNAVPDKAEAWVRAEHAEAAENVDAESENGLWHITAHGIGGHASAPENTVNAIGVLVNYLLSNKLAGANEERFLRILSTLHSATDGSSFGAASRDGKFGPLTVIGGMVGVENGRIFQTVDSRYPGSTDGRAIADALRVLAGGDADVVTERDTPPFYIEPDSAEVRACLNAYRLVTGDDAKPYTIGGGTYARRFPNAVSFGPEHPERPQPEWAGPIHGVDEAASKEYFLEALKIYIIALLELEQLEF